MGDEQTPEERERRTRGQQDDVEGHRMQKGVDMEGDDVEGHRMQKG